MFQKIKSSGLSPLQVGKRVGTSVISLMSPTWTIKAIPTPADEIWPVLLSNIQKPETNDTNINDYKIK